jgi:phage terminase Nu1 subunit (DNA packaging protein)
MDLTKPVSGRELARLTGQSEGAVRKAKNRGSILKGLTADGKFIPSIASNEWGKPILKEFFSDSVEAKKPVVKKLDSVKTKVPKKEKKEAETIEEFVNEIMHEKLPSAEADDLDDETVSEELDDRIQKPEAERVTAVLKAKILQITYKEKQGQLVPIDKVNSVLFGYGQEIRNAFESVPDRIIDRILAVAEKRHEARKILVDEIHDTLELLADINTRELK